MNDTNFEQLKQSGLNYLRQALNQPEVEFRAGQWDSIARLLDNKRALVVQRTGWGKSMVYFLATRLLRDRGAGPTLLVSPLLSLMRNQIEAAERIGIHAATINSGNVDEWSRVSFALANNQVDILLISPERLGNPEFQQEILGGMLNRIGLLVIDEAHCISDWGHDFRPDYRRIVKIVQSLPPTIPILATTATANNRVVQDVQSQLGNDIDVVRGTLVRKSLKLQNISLPDPTERLAWLAGIIPTLPSSGIVYTLTQRDALMVAQWLQNNGISALAYHSDVAFSDDSADQVARWGNISLQELYKMPDLQRNTMYKEYLEQMLLGNKIKVLVATVALGMGFDKPDLGFVIHYQRPSSVVHYYQQVGRAGRAVDQAFGVLLCGAEDDRIADYFIRSAFPPQKHIGAILQTLLRFPEEGLSAVQLQRRANLRAGQIDKALRYLTVEEPCPVIKQKTKWFATPAARTYQIDQKRVEGITNLRLAEQQQMRDYMSCTTCLMRFLQQALDDPSTEDCGQCASCTPDKLLSTAIDPELLTKAQTYLRGSYQIIEPRKRWPEGGVFEKYPFAQNSIIPPTIQMAEGRALSLWLDGGWGQQIAEGMYNQHHFDDQLVQACANLVSGWEFEERPQWVTCVPSLRSGELVPRFASRLAAALKLPFRPRIRKIIDNPAQEVMENSYQQVLNLDGAFALDIPPAAPGRTYAPCLLIDDTVNSRWTLTVVSALLRQVGCRAVYPLVLAMKMD